MHEPSTEAPPNIPGLPPLGEVFENSPTGAFQYYFDAGSFYWSEEMLAIHGYEPGEVVPTFDLGMSHILPELREQADAYWAEVTSLGGPLSTYLTLEDKHGSRRQVLIVSDQIHHEDRPIGVWGAMIDVTRSVRIDSTRLVNEAVAASAAGRGVIEQAKGILMGRTGITAEQAFRLISQHSQDTNRKVGVIAQQIVKQASHSPHDADRSLPEARMIVESI